MIEWILAIFIYLAIAFITRVGISLYILINKEPYDIIDSTIITFLSIVWPITIPAFLMFTCGYIIKGIGNLADYVSKIIYWKIKKGDNHE